MSTKRDDDVTPGSTAKKSARSIRYLFAVMAAAVIGTTVFTYYFGNRVLTFRNLAAAHRSVITESARLLSALTDAETGQRGFLVTGDDDYLAPYDNARVQLPGIVDRLRKTKIISLRPETLRIIEALAETKLAELERTIAMRREQGLEGAATIVKNGVGNQTMIQLRDQIGRLQAQQEAALRVEAAAADRATKARTVAFTLAGLANLLFIAWAYRRIAREMKGREEALAETTRERAEVQRQKDLLAVTLASIGDCVIVTDKIGRITFMNTVAEKLTGWSFNEGRLRPVSDVFKIVNEFTRKPAEDPVERVIRTGRYRWPGESHPARSQRRQRSSNR